MEYDNTNSLLDNSKLKNDLYKSLEINIDLDNELNNKLKKVLGNIKKNWVSKINNYFNEVDLHLKIQNSNLKVIKDLFKEFNLDNLEINPENLNLLFDRIFTMKKKFMEYRKIAKDINQTIKLSNINKPKINFEKIKDDLKINYSTTIENIDTFKCKIYEDLKLKFSQCYKLFENKNINAFTSNFYYETMKIFEDYNIFILNKISHYNYKDLWKAEHNQPDLFKIIANITDNLTLIRISNLKKKYLLKI